MKTLFVVVLGVLVSACSGGRVTAEAELDAGVSVEVGGGSSGSGGRDEDDLVRLLGLAGSGGGGEGGEGADASEPLDDPDASTPDADTPDTADAAVGEPDAGADAEVLECATTNDCKDCLFITGGMYQTCCRSGMCGCIDFNPDGPFCNTDLGVPSGM